MPESNPISVSIVLLAAGRGERLGANSPKQYLELAGRPLLTHSLERLIALPGVNELVLVLPGGQAPPEIQSAIDAIIAAYPDVNFANAAGGARRQDSVAAGLAALDKSDAPESTVILVHDSARPFPPRAETVDLIASAQSTGGAILALRATDTIKQSDEGGRIKATLNRNQIWLAQTPQAFRREHLAKMIETLRGSSEFTDEAAALEAMNVPVALVEGTPTNFKVTSAEDLLRAERELDSM